MRYSNPLFWAALLSCILILSSSCNPNRDGDDGPEPITSFTNGFFIVNEGIEGNRDGSLSFYDRGREEVVNQIFENKNEEALDGTLTSMTKLSSRAYIVQNRLGQITIAETESMGKLGIIPGFQRPRYFQTISNEKAYVSQWGEDGGSGSIEIIDLSTSSISGSIPTPGGPERMIQQGNHIYLTHTGGFFLDSVVTKIDINTNQIIKTISIGQSPQSIQIDANGAIWVLAKGLESFSESRPSTLARIENDEVVFSITLPLGSRDLTIDNNRNTLYYINGLNQKVYQHDISNSSLALAPFSDVPITALGFDPLTNLPVGLDSKNFQVEGQLFLFDAQGDVTEEFDLSYVPSYLIF